MFQPKTQRSERFALYALLVLYLASACGFAFVTPYGEAPDEYAHLGYIEYVVRFHKLPPIAAKPYTYEAFQPPLYHMLGAAMVILGRNMINSPRAEGLLTPPPHNNPEAHDKRSKRQFQMLLHPPEERWSFWPYALRSLSIMMGLGVVLLTYATARALVPLPASPTAPLIATAFAALIPQANFIRASITSENLADLIGAWIIWLLVLHLTKPYATTRIVWLGVALGLGSITKLSLVPLLLPILWVLWLRHSGPVKRWLRDLAFIGLPVIVLAGWFYIYRWSAYGDPLATRAISTMLTDVSPFHLDTFFWLTNPFRWFVWSSFWGVYGWQVIWMQSWIYFLLTLLTMLAVVGDVYLVWRRALSTVQQATCVIMLVALLLMYAVVVYISTDHVIWQGRELFPALSSTCILLGLGLGGVALGRAAVQPLSVKPWRQRLGSAMVVAVTAGLLALNIYSIFGLVLPLLNA